MPKQCGRKKPCSSTTQVHRHIHLRCAQDNNSFHAPVMMVARVLLYFFRIVSANLKKKLLNTPWSALFTTRSNVICSTAATVRRRNAAPMAHELAKKRLNSRTLLCTLKPGGLRRAQPQSCATQPGKTSQPHLAVPLKQCAKARGAKGDHEQQAKQIEYQPKAVEAEVLDIEAGLGAL